MQERTGTLRERHRAETATEIHRAGLDLAEQEGCAATTVEAVAERAGVSRRTFFNYYASKEDAILGLKPVEMPAPALERYLDRGTGDEFTRTVWLFVAVLRHSSGPPEWATRRKRLVDQHPELKRRIGLHLASAESLVAAVVSEHSSPTTATRSPETSQAFVLLAGSVLKYAHRVMPDLSHTADDAAVDRALDRAIGVFRTAFKEIS